MGISRINFNGATLIDLSNDYITPNLLLHGAHGHNQTGDIVYGKRDIDASYVYDLNYNFLFYGMAEFSHPPVYHDNNTSYRTYFGNENKTGIDCIFGHKYKIDSRDFISKSLLIRVYILNQNAYDAILQQNTVSDDDYIVYMNQRSFENPVIIFPPKTINNVSTKSMVIEFKSPTEPVTHFDVGNIVIVDKYSEQVSNGFYIDENGILHTIY